ncbi:hypothetical protein BDV10DRAFT_199693 [Aspergillus recurvatus]
MSAKEFLADVKNGVVPVDSHDKVLQIAFIYMDEGLWQDNGVFDVVEKLHAHEWSFGEGELRFNRHSGINRSDQMDGGFPSPDDFDTFYTTHHALLNPSAWRSYYSETFLTQRTTARFYRLPDLQDLPDTDFPLAQPRKRPHPGGGIRATKLPRWAYSVSRTRRRQPLLLLETFTELALNTLKTTITRLRAVYPSVLPYSETQARFWFEYMNLGSPAAKAVSGNRVGGELGKEGVVEPGVEDGVWKSKVMWCGWPDGGIGAEAWWRRWEGEEFLAAVAVEETVGVELGELDFAVRSHVLLGVMQAAVKEGQEREVFLEELERGMVRSGRIGEDTAGVWLREALGVDEPYVRIWEGVWPDAEEEWAEVLRQILVDNGQLFARWKLSPHLKEFNFGLGPRELE